MSTLRIPVAMATSVVALLCASTSFAQETTQPDPPSPKLQQAQPRQQPVQSVTVQPTPAQPPASTTKTTAARYVPPGGERVHERTVEHWPNPSLLSTGTGLFIFGYGPSVAAAVVSPRDADRRLFIPVAGPWMDLNNRGCNARTPCGRHEDLARGLIVTSGVVQGAGVLLALGSLMIPETTTVRERTMTKQVKPEVRIIPLSFAAGAGLGAVGRF